MVLFCWITYDAGKLCQRMQPDEYVQGVLNFYTDFLVLVCCCCLAACHAAPPGGARGPERSADPVSRSDE